MIPPRAVLALLEQLPEAPPAQVTATALNLVRPLLWPEEPFDWLTGRKLRLDILKLNVGVTLTHNGDRFVPSSGAGDVRFAATVADYWVMARRMEDPDTLFFQRRLLIEGDTELGLRLKNLLDATDWDLLLNRLPPPVASHFRQ
ncbi:hypothetical protein GCM10007860_28730 [Chitiniphilus shinanonensis]|uniref:SCP2 domain-containing protein n=1 Tax=Chitiniphilus shinanonensis TaxID=553088 RepID=A0ABQ6BWK5_9NEIS|nr:SCP2 sterol-binding domain-containing protein [Chitiniphilus shinanonensis]GLS05716.1 hypothetical protein GCM10007860_28730 [Chitiniphilus shinanonensis]